MTIYITNTDIAIRWFSGICFIISLILIWKDIKDREKWVETKRKEPYIKENENSKRNV